MHDLIDAKCFGTGPANALVQSYFYEDDPAKPDNVFENYLASMEGRAKTAIDAVVAEALAVPEGKRGLHGRGSISQAINDNYMADTIEFVAFQYFRVPGAAEQKRFEVSVSPGTAEEKEAALRPGQVTFQGFRYAIERFRRMKRQLFVSQSQDFLTSDRPSFDLKDSDDSPLLGEDIGNDPGVVLYCPLHPRVGLILYPPEMSAAAPLVPDTWCRPVSDCVVRNQNTLVIQQAERFVVASREESFIPTVAKKRKKGYGSS